MAENKHGLFTSDLTVNEYVLVEDAGFEPLGLVVGSSICHRPAHGRPFTSDLSGQDFWTLRRAGARPVGLVLGRCVYSVASFTTMGWRMWRNLELPHFTQALYDARELAMTRMQQEAKAIGATGIVGVQLTEHQHGWGGRAIEFLALGTAITRDAAPTGTAGAIATPVIDLSGNPKRD